LLWRQNAGKVSEVAALDDLARRAATRQISAQVFPRAAFLHGKEENPHSGKVRPAMNTTRSLMQAVLRRSAAALFALAFLALPSVALAENITFRNETGGNVIVQATASSGGVPQVEKPFVLNSKAASAPISLPGRKIVEIYDAKQANKLIGKATFSESNKDVIYIIVPDGNGTVKIERRTAP